MTRNKIADGKIYVAYHNCWVDLEITVVCGAIAEFDHGSECGYRCTECSAIIGSVGMPQRCRLEMEKDDIIKKIKR